MKTSLVIMIAALATLVAAQVEASVFTVRAQQANTSAERAAFCSGAPASLKCVRFTLWIDDECVTTEGPGTPSNAAPIVRQFSDSHGPEAVEAAWACDAKNVWKKDVTRSWVRINRLLDMLGAPMSVAEIAAAFNARAAANYVHATGAFGIVLDAAPYWVCVYDNLK